MESVLFALRVLMALALYVFLGVMLVVLLREQRPATPAKLLAATLVRISPETPEEQPQAMAITTPVAATPVAHTGERHRLAPDRPTWIGRDPNCAIRLTDEFVSSRHARIDWRTDRQSWWMEDNDSRNGTLVNDERVMRGELKHGDILSIGGVQFRFELTDDS
jgi:predicted component of type VI protein secretion system